MAEEEKPEPKPAAKPDKPEPTTKIVAFQIEGVPLEQQVEGVILLVRVGNRLTMRVHAISASPLEEMDVVRAVGTLIGQLETMVEAEPQGRGDN